MGDGGSQQSCGISEGYGGDVSRQPEVRIENCDQARHRITCGNRFLQLVAIAEEAAQCSQEGGDGQGDIASIVVLKGLGREHAAAGDKEDRLVQCGDRGTSLNHTADGDAGDQHYHP